MDNMEENKLTGITSKKTTSWFMNEVNKRVGDEYQVRSSYIRSKETIIMYHKTCGKEFPTTPDAFLGSRTGNKNKGNRCPFCSNKWKRDTAAFKQEVFDMYGDEFEVIGVYKNRHKGVDILHKPCKNILKNIRPRHFLDGNSYCMYCSQKEKKDTMRFKEQVFELVGNEYTVLGKYVDAKTHTPIRHAECGSVNYVSPDNFLRGRRCKNCTNMQNSKGYQTIYNILTLNQLPFDTEYRDYNCKNLKPLPFDFVIYNNWLLDKIVAFIEFDGEQHERASSFFGGEEGFKKRKKNDKIKDEFAKQQDIPLIRIKYKDVKNLEYVLQKELKNIGVHIDILGKLKYVASRKIS